MTPATLPPGHSAAAGQPEEELRDPAPGRRAGTGWVILTGVVAAAVAMALWLMFCAEVANDPTPVTGTDSSTWTPLTGITSFLFGVDAFDGDFHVLSILFGAAAHLFVGVAFGLVGVGLIAYTFAGRPGVGGGAALGLAYGLVLEVLVRNIVVNWVQDVHTVADALPSLGVVGRARAVWDDARDSGSAPALDADRVLARSRNHSRPVSSVVGRG